MKRNLWALALAASLAACGGSATDGAGELTDRSTYPVEGIGRTEGSVIANLSFQNTDGSEFSLGDVFADPQNRVMLIVTTAGWCTACIEEQPALKALHNEYSGKGLYILSAMFEDAAFNTATLEQVRDWDEEYDLPYRLVLDESFKLGAYYDPSATPMNMVVDVDTMEIVKIVVGNDPAVVRAVVEAHLDL